MSPGVDAVVRGYLDHLTVERGLAANTLVAYQRDLRRYAAYLGERHLADPVRSGKPMSRPSWSTCGTGTGCRRVPPPGPWQQFAGYTASRSANA